MTTLNSIRPMYVCRLEGKILDYLLEGKGIEFKCSGLEIGDNNEPVYRFKATMRINYTFIGTLSDGRFAVLMGRPDFPMFTIYVADEATPPTDPATRSLDDVHKENSQFMRESSVYAVKSEDGCSVSSTESPHFLRKPGLG